MKILAFSCGVILLVVCVRWKSTARDEQVIRDAPVEEITFAIIESYENTFGYDIYIQEKRIIHQPNIPALPGKNGFRTKSDAEKVAKYVIAKLREGEMPPVMLIDELKDLGIIN